MKMATIACAIYTRKSSEEGLEQGFNSLDAQREACAAYILSQMALGWTPVPDSYDDGGYSGGNVERPGLKRLLADIQARKVAVVVVYKVDRLTRSLADFAKMVELFDAHGVSFVSVTQQFNTTTSMGRLTLNVLLSFAQFEREVTGERIRDKIAASKRKGMWMGGIPAVGYEAKERSLAIVEQHAQQIRQIYRLYLELGCVRKLKSELDRRGWITPPRTTKRAGAGGCRPFSRGHLYRILSNPLYIGRIPHKDQTFPGNHPAIIEMDLWDAVQDRLKANRQGDKVKAHAANPSVLAGLVFDERGQRLTASHAKKGARRYRYYVGAKDPDDQDHDVLRIPANELEGLVSQAAQAWLNDGSKVIETARASNARQAQDRIEKARVLARRIKESPRLHLAGCIRRITVGLDWVRIALNPATLGMAEALEASDDDPPVIEVPVKLRRCGMAVRLIVNAAEVDSRRAPDATLIALLAKAHDWFGALTSGRIESIAALASRERVSAGYATRMIHLALMAPDIVERMVRGEQPPELTAAKLMQWMPLPQDWSEQRRMLGFG